MRYRVLLGNDLGVQIKDLTYPELIREVDRLIHETISFGLSGIEISFIEEVDDEGEGSKDLAYRQD